MGIKDDILAAAQTLLGPQFYIPPTMMPTRSIPAQTSTPAAQASPLEVDRANALAASNRARAFEKVKEAEAAKANQQVADMLALLSSQSSAGTPVFAAKGDKMLKGEGIGREFGGGYSKVKSIPTELEKGLKALGLPGETAVINPQVMQQAALLKQLGFMSEGDARAAEANQKFELLKQLFGNDAISQDLIEALLQSGFDSKSTALSDYFKAKSEKK